MRVNALKEILNNKGLDFGLAKLETPLSLELYKAYLDKGYHAEMTYLQSHLPQKETPQLLLNTAKSAIVIRRPYYPHPYSMDLPKLKIASYAKGEDYHHWFRREMQELIEELKQTFTDEDFICFTDSSPVLERDLAYRAGLGWIGKNSCLISPDKGSLFFIGEIFTSIDIEDHKATLIPDRCGTCTRCIEACPTQALTNNRTMDASKCISYITIEAKNNAPEELRDKLDGWYFGCDICQTVCPWNQKVFGRDAFKKQENEEDVKESLRFILTSSNRQIEAVFAKSALLRASANSHRRNAIQVAVHHQFKDLLEVILPLKQKYQRLSEIVDWAEKKLT